MLLQLTNGVNQLMGYTSYGDNSIYEGHLSKLAVHQQNEVHKLWGYTNL